jgi:hypothetical protein
LDFISNTYSSSRHKYTQNSILINPHRRSGSTLPQHHASESFNWQITLFEKAIAITGANRDIGLGIAVKTVFSLDITDPGDKFKALAERFPGRLEYVQTNVTDEESVEKSINTMENRPPPPPPTAPQKPPSATSATLSPWNGANTAFASAAFLPVSCARS